MFNEQEESVPLESSSLRKLSEGASLSAAREPVIHKQGAHDSQFPSWHGATIPERRQQNQHHIYERTGDGRTLVEVGGPLGELLLQRK